MLDSGDLCIQLDINVIEFLGLFKLFFESLLIMINSRKNAILSFCYLHRDFSKNTIITKLYG